MYLKRKEMLNFLLVKHFTELSLKINKNILFNQFANFY